MTLRMWIRAAVIAFFVVTSIVVIHEGYNGWTISMRLNQLAQSLPTSVKEEIFDRTGIVIGGRSDGTWDEHLPIFDDGIHGPDLTDAERNAIFRAMGKVDHD